MREIVHLQAGQCGNQIGAKVSFNLSVINCSFMFIEHWLQWVTVRNGFSFICMEFKASFRNANVFADVLRQIINSRIKSVFI